MIAQMILWFNQNKFKVVCIAVVISLLAMFTLGQLALVLVPVLIFFGLIWILMGLLSTSLLLENASKGLED